MRILLLTQWFDPEPTLKGLAFAQALSRRGHQVHVVTGFPNYPGGRLYDGYRLKLLRRERHGDVRVWRVPLFPSHDTDKWGRLANYLSFMFSALVAGLFVRRPDAIYAYHPPLTVGIAARILGVLRRAPVLCDVQDLWPDTLLATGMVSSRRLLALVGAAARWTYGGMAAIAVLSSGFRDALAARGHHPSRLLCIPNWAPQDLDRLEVGPPQSRAEPIRVMFAGNMGKAQGLGAVLDAIEIVNASDRGAATFVFLGGGLEREALEASAGERGLANASFLPAVPLDAVQPYLAAADVLLVHLADDPLFAITIPSKTQAYLAMGRPIVMAVRGDAAALVTEARAGVCACPGDPHSIAQAVLSLARMSHAERVAMGQRGRAYYEARLSFAVGSQRFGEALEGLSR